MCNSKHVAKVYQQISQISNGERKKKTADLWSTEELSTNFAELVGQDGRVVAVDPDIYRVVVPRESHRKVKNRAYHEGSAASFPGTDSETYDMIFSNFVHPFPPSIPLSLLPD